ncbi:hypothetical protein LJY25_08580 [Hymenobacter sp. BT175]|nr:hypothetical protein [Hymenobacter translucens]
MEPVDANGPSAQLNKPEEISGCRAGCIMVVLLFLVALLIGFGMCARNGLGIQN